MAFRLGILTHKYPRDNRDRVDARIHIYDFAHAFAKHASVYVFAPDWGGEKELDAYVPVTWFPTGKNIFRIKQAAIEFAQKNSIDFCFAAWAMPAGYLAYHVKKALHIPYGIWALGSDIHTYARYPILRQLIARYLAYADLRFANSYRLRDDVTRLSRKDCTFMPVISDFPSYSKKIRPNLRNPFQFLYVGRLEDVKGIDILIEASALLKEQNALFQLHVIGDGALRDHLEQQVKEKGFDNKIVFLGNQDKESVIAHMRNAECLVIPSRKESFPQVLLEAARLGLPAIAAGVGDCPRIMNTYRCGMLVLKNSPQQLAEAMEQMIKRRDQLQQLYGKGLRKFVREFTRTPPEMILMHKLQGLYKK